MIYAARPSSKNINITAIARRNSSVRTTKCSTGLGDVEDEQEAITKQSINLQPKTTCTLGYKQKLLNILHIIGEKSWTFIQGLGNSPCPAVARVAQPTSYCHSELLAVYLQTRLNLFAKLTPLSH